MNLIDPPAVEARPYGPTASEEDRAALRARVSWFADGIILLREVPVMTAFSVETIFGELRRLTASGEPYAILVDLTEAGRPSAEIREHVRTALVHQKDRTRHAALFTGSFFLSVAAKFIFGGLGFASISSHTTREQALKAIRDVDSR